MGSGWRKSDRGRGWVSRGWGGGSDENGERGEAVGWATGEDGGRAREGMRGEQVERWSGMVGVVGRGAGEGVGGGGRGLMANEGVGGGRQGWKWLGRGRVVGKGVGGGRGRGRR